MSGDTIYEGATKRTRRGMASYFRRLARALSRGEPIPADEEQTVTVDLPAESEFEVGVEREDGTVILQMELAFDESEGVVETDVVASKARFELFEDNAKEWRWRLVHRNGNIIADSSEGYASKQKAKQGLESVRKNAPGAYVVDTSKDEQSEPTDEGGSSATFELFEDNAGKWRWRLVHHNGNIIGDGGQGYASKQKAKQGLRSVKQNVRGAPVETAD